MRGVPGPTGGLAITSLLRRRRLVPLHSTAMSYLVLARKYRPRTFEEVCGQEVPTRVLQGAIREERIGHAYLFSGPRGTGKTTSARIFAKALNCERGPTPTPCGECERCLANDAGSEADIIEIDAASNRGIDDARALRDEVGYAPMRARFKVYIIDEVHMLTKEAFNALLKTLEEPPAHAKFLFATTEPHKVIETIRSRCQMISLGLIDEPTIAGRLAEILSLEGVVPEEGVVAELARLARGSMRDALSVTDQLLALVGTAPTLADVRRVSGPAGAEQIESLLARVEAGDRAGVLDALPDTEGAEPDLVSGLLASVRAALIAGLASGGPADAAQDPSGASRAQRVGSARLQVWLEELLHARERMALLPEHARIVLEVTLLDLCREETALPLALLVNRLGALEERLGVATPQPSPGGGAPVARTAQPRPPEQREARRPAPAPQVAPASRPPQAPPAPSARPAPEGVPGPAPAAAPAAAPAPRRDAAPRPADAAPREAPRTAPERAPATITPAAPPRAPTAPAAPQAAPEAAAAPAEPEVESKSKDPAPAGEGDLFTQSVADLFEGQIEDKT